MRSHPLYRRKLKSKVVFDDQRPGWDSTSRDLTKYKLTDEQVEVSAVPVAHRPASPVASPDRERGRFSNSSADSTLTARPNRPLARRRVASNSSARTSQRLKRSSARVRTSSPSSVAEALHKSSLRGLSDDL